MGLMGKITGFLEIEREDRTYEPAADRIRHYREFVIPPSEAEIAPPGRPLHGLRHPLLPHRLPGQQPDPRLERPRLPRRLEVAAQNLHSTNNFPEVTGRICPAPCEAACTLNIIDVPVTIKSIECAIADKAFDEGWVTADAAGDARPASASPIVGSGPAGLAAAQQLARAGHDVHVYEKSAYPGGLLRYGIPDFKMEKYIVERRVKQMEAEGVTFHCNVHVGARSAASRSSSAIMTPCCSPAAPSSRATSPCPAAISPASISP